MTDSFPAASFSGATYTAAGAGGASGFTASGSGSIADTVTLPVGATITYTVTAHVNPSATGSLANTASVAMPAGLTDPTPGNNSATDTDTLTPQADIAVTVDDGVTSIPSAATRPGRSRSRTTARAPRRASGSASSKSVAYQPASGRRLTGTHLSIGTLLPGASDISSMKASANNTAPWPRPPRTPPTRLTPTRPTTPAPTSTLSRPDRLAGLRACLMGAPAQTTDAGVPVTLHRTERTSARGPPNWRGRLRGVPGERRGAGRDQIGVARSRGDRGVIGGYSETGKSRAVIGPLLDEINRHEKSLGRRYCR